MSKLLNQLTGLLPQSRPAGFDLIAPYIRNTKNPDLLWFWETHLFPQLRLARWNPRRFFYLRRAKDTQLMSVLGEDLGKRVRITLEYNPLYDQSEFLRQQSAELSIAHESVHIADMMSGLLETDPVYTQFKGNLLTNDPKLGPVIYAHVLTEARAFAYAYEHQETHMPDYPLTWKEWSKVDEALYPVWKKEDWEDFVYKIYRYVRFHNFADQVEMDFWIPFIMARVLSHRPFRRSLRSALEK